MVNNKVNKRGAVTTMQLMHEWYHVYEMRLGINLLEPWEKAIANAFFLGLAISPLAIGSFILSAIR